MDHGHRVRLPGGVDIVAELGRHGYRLSPGTVYPVFHELEQAGYLSVRSTVVSGKQRKYYKATTEGREALEAATDKLRELADELLDERKRNRGTSSRSQRTHDQ